jgi:uncharacterized Tic20 family protein
MSESEKRQNRWARLAGFLYLFTYIVPITGWTICGGMEVTGNFVETAHRVASNELLYRFGLSLLLITSMLCILLAMSFYAALKPVNGALALFGLLFRLVENTIGIVFSLLDFVMVKALTDSGVSGSFDAKQLGAFYKMLGEADGVEFNVAMICLGIGSAFFFYLLLKSRYIPRVLSILGLVACPIFSGVSLACLYWPQNTSMLHMGWYPMAAAEISVGFWLMIRGLKFAPAQLSNDAQ